MLLTWNPRIATGVDGETLKMVAVVDVHQQPWSYKCPIHFWSKSISVGLVCLGALFYALVRKNTRWRCTKNARNIVRKSRWKLFDGVQQEIVRCSTRWRSICGAYTEMLCKSGRSTSNSSGDDIVWRHT